jgi:ABC-2 type transport system permease protein
VCAWSALVYIVFWTISVSSIAQLFDDLWSAGGYPVVFFPAPIRIVLTFIFPVAFATTMPVNVLTGRGEWWQPPLALGATVLALALIRFWWKYAIRSYASASS